eukprot:TRINITY_DN6292_c0_g1_i7.p1 TRINITY_DN6292_c0_g1~~TRINITY_DN6292_c0_g1_i7.p1  ORF type:complete len:271 (+),score=12.05 TRINITY_DN6292_c0_g1_i7:235-1047(+)
MTDFLLYVRNGSIWDGTTVYSCSHYPQWTPPCISAIVVSVCATLTFLVGIACTIRIIHLIRKWCSLRVMIHFVILIYYLTMMIWYFFFNFDWIYFAFELLKVTALFMTVTFFSFSLFNFNILPPIVTKRLLMVLIVLLYLPILVTYAMANYFNYGEGIGCRNVARIIFSGLELFIVMIFTLLSFAALQSNQDRWGVVVLESYILRYTRPMVVVNLVYAFSSITNLSVRVWTFSVVTNDHSSCSSVLVCFFCFPLPRFRHLGWSRKKKKKT